MNTNESPSALDHDSIIQLILNDQIDIDSVAEFETLLEVFPEDPDLYRKFGDLLSAGKQPEKALLAYNKAAALYLEAGMVLQSIVAKILEWSIVKPSHREGREYHAAIRNKGDGDVPAQLLFSQLTYEETVSLMLRLSRVRLSPGEIVYDVGHESTGIYFIVSGRLTETLPQKKGGGAPATMLLAENDIFGDIFPLEEKSFCRACVTAATDVELVKIFKPTLKATCYRYPRVRDMLERLSRMRVRQGGDRSWKTVRRSSRYCLPADVRLTFSANGNGDRKTIQGTARDLSTGGMCVALSNDTVGADLDDGLLREKVAMTILEGNRTAIDQLTGVVAWRKKVGSATHPTHIVGIVFDPMAEETEMALNAFCTISNGEQDMIWNLWNHLVRH
jgi:CRP-like cAMP-binding protein